MIPVNRARSYNPKPSRNVKGTLPGFDPGSAKSGNPDNSNANNQTLNPAQDENLGRDKEYAIPSGERNDTAAARVKQDEEPGWESAEKAAVLPFEISGSSILQGIILSEVLGKPRSKRRGR